MYLALEILALLSSFLFPFFCAYLAYESTWGLWEMIMTIGTSGLGILAADFFSGFSHWLFDRYGTEQTPILGKALIFPFREHHTDQKAMTHHGFIEANGNTAIALQIVILPTVLFGLLKVINGFNGFVSFLLFFEITLLLTNEFHKWAHQDDVPKLIRTLQRMRLILSPEHHSQHHVYPFDKNYCITGGWLDPLLLKIGFFKKIENTLEWLFDVRPYQGKKET